MSNDASGKQTTSTNPFQFMAKEPESEFRRILSCNSISARSVAVPLSYTGCRVAHSVITSQRLLPLPGLLHSQERPTTDEGIPRRYPFTTRTIVCGCCFRVALLWGTGTLTTRLSSREERIWIQNSKQEINKNGKVELVFPTRNFATQNDYTS